MNFQVPKFIELEDKIFGPLTFKQFMYIAGGFGLAFLIYIIKISLFFKIIPILAFAGFGVALAFYKVNEQPFIVIVEAALNYFFSDKLYLWKKDGPQKEEKGTEAAAAGPASASKRQLTEGKLRDLTWSLDIQEKIR